MRIWNFSGAVPLLPAHPSPQQAAHGSLQIPQFVQYWTTRMYTYHVEISEMQSGVSAFSGYAPQVTMLWPHPGGKTKSSRQLCIKLSGGCQQLKLVGIYNLCHLPAMCCHLASATVGIQYYKVKCHVVSCFACKLQVLLQSSFSLQTAWKRFLTQCHKSTPCHAQDLAMPRHLLRTSHGRSERHAEVSRQDKLPNAAARGYLPVSQDSRLLLTSQQQGTAT